MLFCIPYLNKQLLLVTVAILLLCNTLAIVFWFQQSIFTQRPLAPGRAGRTAGFESDPRPFATCLPLSSSPFSSPSLPPSAFLSLFTALCSKAEKGHTHKKTKNKTKTSCIGSLNIYFFWSVSVKPRDGCEEYTSRGAVCEMLRTAHPAQTMLKIT